MYRLTGAMLGLIVFTAQAAGAELPVRLTVAETGGVARPNWPVTSGVPLPRGAVKDVRALALKDAAGTSVPCQIDAVTRWPDGSVKWVEVNFQADLPAGGKAQFTLEKGKPAAPTGPVTVTETAEAVTVDTGAIAFTVPKKRGAIIGEVRAGGKKLLIGRGLSLLGMPFARDGKSKNWGGGSPPPSVERGDIQPGPNCGTETWTVTPVAKDAMKIAGSRTGDDGVCMVSDCSTRWGENPRAWRSKSGKIVINPGWWAGGKFPVGKGAEKQFRTDSSQAGVDFSTVFGKVETVEVERAGPMMARVHLLLTCSSKDGKAYIPTSASRKKYNEPSGDFFKVRVRLHAYAGKPFISMIVSLLHGGPMDDSPDAFFKSAALTFKPAAPLKSAEADGVSGSTAGAGFALFQYLGAGRPNYASKMSRKKPEPYYKVLVGGEEKKKGNRASGSVVATGAAGTLGFGVRRFYDYAPTAIAVRAQAVSVELLPDDPEQVMHMLDQGRQRSHEVLLDVSADAARHLAAFQAPRLLALAPPKWYADLEVFGMIAEEVTDLSRYPQEVRKPIRRFEQLQKCLVDGKFAENKRGTVFGSMHPGWLDYGDLPWTCDWSNGHYDWSLGMILHFLRTGKREFFEAADAMAWHRMDIAQNHSLECGKVTSQQLWSQGQTYYEKDDHRSLGQGPKLTHTWNRGLGYYALLTGNETARQVTLLSGQGIRQYYDRYGKSTLETGKGGGGWRGPGPYASRTREQRAEGWSIENLLGCYEVTGDEKYRKWATNLFHATIEDYKRQNSFKDKGCGALMFGYVLSPSCRAHYYSKDPDILAGIKYIVDQGMLSGHGIFRGGEKVGGGKEMNTGLYYTNKIWLTFNIFCANPLAYLYMQTGDEKYLDLARKVFRNGTFYYTHQSAGPIDPTGSGKLSPAAYHDGMYAGSVTKVHGWLGRFNQVYLYMEKQLARGVTFPRK